MKRTKDGMWQRGMKVMTVMRTHEEQGSGESHDHSSQLPVWNSSAVSKQRPSAARQDKPATATVRLKMVWQRATTRCDDEIWRRDKSAMFMQEDTITCDRVCLGFRMCDGEVDTNPY